MEQRKLDIGTPVGIGTIVGSFVDVKHLLVRCNVSNQEIAFIRPDKPAIVTTVGGQTFRGKVVSVASTADPITHTFEVGVLFTNTNYKTRIGEAATVEMPTVVQKAHKIPSSALILDQAGHLGVMVDIQGRARFRRVSIQEETPTGTWVVGLPSKANIIVQGQDYIVSGARLAVRSGVKRLSTEVKPLLKFQAGLSKGTKERVRRAAKRVAKRAKKRVNRKIKSSKRKT